MKKGKEGDIVGHIIGLKIAARRAELGLSRDQFCKLAGVSVEDMTNFETGKSRPDPGILFKLAKCLDVSPPYFFSLPENLGSGGRALMEKLHNGEDDYDVSVSDGVAVIRAFARIKNLERRDIVLDIAQMIAKRGAIK
jgi:transcriptional regulator with XRE-family HTH domain